MKLTKYCDNFIYVCLLLFAFTVPLSIAVSEGIFVLGLIAWIVKMISEKKFQWHKTPLDVPILVFAAIALLSSFWGVNVKNSLIGFRTYGLILIIYLLLNNLTSEKTKEHTSLTAPCTDLKSGTPNGQSYSFATPKIFVRALLLGGAILSIFTIVDRLSRIAQGSNPILAGSMSEAGQLLIIIGIAMAILLYREERKIRVLLLIAILLMITAQILNFKRGSWISLMFVLGIQGWVKSRKMILAAIFAAAAIFIFYKPAADRLTSLKDEFSPTRGGRLAMWETTPSILRDHPMGVGIDNVNSVLYKYNSAIESGRAHLHSTPLQILAEMGPLGLIAFLWWMAVFLKLTLRTFQQLEEKNRYEKALMLGIFSAFIGFLINGLVEFNFGDSEVVMLIYIMMGLTLLLRKNTSNELHPHLFPPPSRGRIEERGKGNFWYSNES